MSEAAFDLVPPEAASLTESLRAFSYETPTAIADLVDNSLTAGSRRIWIDFHWDGPDSVIAITDDGRGMSEDQLRSAMRLGSRSPLDERAADDLGRFGLGLKTASISQCRRVSVRSIAEGAPAVTRCWDLDHVARVRDWQLLCSADRNAEAYFERLGGLRSGTAVVWQKLDRSVAGTRTDSERDQQIFLKRAGDVRRHLGVVFHQLMSGPRAVTLLLNGRPLEPWDPFLASEPATQVLPVTRLTLRESVIEVEPYILPHPSKVSKATHEAAAGTRGWNAHQGFYVYRNRRLLVPGDWLGFGWTKEEHYKLARIRVEVPNALDHDWEIDVTKSRAMPPAPLRDELRRIGERARADAKRVYSHRGARLTPRADEARVLLWEPVARHDKTFYRLNREHPLLKRVLADATNRPALNALIRLVEETVPYPHITISNSERPGSLPGPFDAAADGQVREVMEQVFRSLVAGGCGPKEAVDRLRSLWPFELFPALIESLADTVRRG